MSAQTITQAMILRFPFAVNPSRITDHFEAKIAADMLARTRSERSMHVASGADAWASLRDTQVSDHTKARMAGAEARYAALLELIGDRKVTAAALAIEEGSTRKAMQIVLRRLRDRGLLRVVGSCGRNGKELLYRKAKT